MRILVVEDDDKLRAQLRADLARADFAVDVAANARDALFMIEHETYDAAVLDIGLPDQTGLEVLRSLRSKGNRLPVLLLTARDAWQEKVEGFSAGADDYLTKPFQFEELQARLHALIRRSSGIAPGALQVAGLSLNEAQQTVKVEGQDIELKGVEFRLLRYLMLHPSKVLSRSQLYSHIYDDQTDNDSNVIEVYINHLRSKIGKGLIRTRRGQGYVFGENGEDVS